MLFEHGLHFVGNAGHGKNQRAPDCQAQTRGRAPRIVKHVGALRRHGLHTITPGHHPVAVFKKLLDPGK